MDQCASVLLSFPPDGAEAETLSDEAYDMQIKLHFKRTQKLLRESSAMVQSHAAELISHLDPARQTFSYLFLLDIMLPSDTPLLAAVEPALVDKVLAFLVAFDPRQVRYYGSGFTHIFTAVGTSKLIPASIAVPVLSRALEKIDPTGSLLTTNHLTLARLAYHTNNIPPALPFLGKNIVFYSGSGTLHDNQYLCSLDLAPTTYISKDTGLTLPIRSVQVLEYDYLLGLMYCSVHDWPAAHTAFARVVSFPTRDTGVSKIMVEAHKRWVLTGLLLHGCVDKAPPSTAAQASKVCSVLNKLYMQVAEKFAAFDADGLNAELVGGSETIVFDRNTGLVQQVLAAFPKWQIVSLRKVYSKIPISTVRKGIKTTPESTALATDAEVEALIQDMIDGGMIKARIHRPQGEEDTAGNYLEFLPEVNTLSEQQFADSLAEAATQLRLLKPLYAIANEQLSLNPHYLRQVIRDQKRELDLAERDEGSRRLGRAATGGMYDVDVDDDEDLMTDVMSGY